MASTKSMGRRAAGVGIAALGLAGCGEATTPAAVTDADPCANQAPGTACTWLGVKGQEGFNGDGRPRWETELSQVQDLVFLADGTPWFTDFNNHLVRKVLADDTVVSVVGSTDPIFPGDGPLGGVSPGGAPGATWQLFHPTGMFEGLDGSVVVAGWHNHKLITVDPGTGWVEVLTGGGSEHGRSGFEGDGGPASAALFNQPSDATVDEAGHVYIVDQVNRRVRRIDAMGVIDTIAGTGAFGTAGDGGPAVLAELAWASGASPNPSGGVLHHDGKLYVADTEGHRIRVIDLATGVIDALAGTGASGFGGDGGQAIDATLSAPRDLELGPDGDLYLADTDNGVVRAIDLATGIIRTVAGTGELGIDEREQLPATETRLRRPFGVAFDGAGDLYVVDSLNDRVVKVRR